MSITALLCLLFCLCGSSLYADWAHPEMVAKVASGEVREARVSWWGFDAKDSTKYLRAAIASGVPKLIVDRMPSPWIVMPLRAVSNQHIVFEEGTVLLAKRGRFENTSDRLMSLVEVENVRITGYGATFRMWRKDYAHGKDRKGCDYKRGEWRHALSMSGARNVIVEGLTLEESGGDGIYVSNRGKEPCRNITIRDCVCDRNHRQGISIISAENLLVENCVFKNTKGAAPEDGVDFEPNNANDRFVNCVMRNCVSENNAGNGFEIALSKSRKTTLPCSIRFENCRTVGDSVGIKIRTRCRATNGDYPTGSISFDSCSVFKSRYEAVEIMQNPENAINVALTNCMFESIGMANPDAPAVVLTSPFPDDPKPAMPDVVNLKWTDRGSRALSHYATMNFAAIGEETLPLRKAEIVDAEIVDLKPGDSVAGSPLQFRRHLRLVAYADRARRVKVHVRLHRIGSPSSRLPKQPVMVSDVTGKTVASIPFVDFGASDMSFDTPAAGFYVIQMNLDGHACSVARTDAPLAVDCSPWIYKKHACPQGMIASSGSLFIPVKAGKRAEFRVGGFRMNESVSLAIADPSGKTVFENPAVCRWMHYLTEANETAGVWKMTFGDPSSGVFDDFSVALSGVRPFLFISPEKFWYSK